MLLSTLVVFAVLLGTGLLVVQLLRAATDAARRGRNDVILGRELSGGRFHGVPARSGRGPATALCGALVEAERSLYRPERDPVTSRCATCIALGSERHGLPRWRLELVEDPGSAGPPAPPQPARPAGR